MTGIHIRICEWVEEVEKEEPRRRRRSSPALLLLLILKEELRRRRRSSSCAHFPEETSINQKKSLEFVLEFVSTLLFFK